MLEPEPLHQAVVRGGGARRVDLEPERAAARAAGDLDREQEQRCPGLDTGGGAVHERAQRQIQIRRARLLEHRSGGAGQLLEASRVGLAGDRGVGLVVLAEVGEQQLGIDLACLARALELVDRAELVVGDQRDRLAGVREVVEPSEPRTGHVQIDDLCRRLEIQQAIAGAEVEQRPLPLADARRCRVAGVENDVVVRLRRQQVLG